MPCGESCECCGFHTHVGPVRCEIRRKSFGCRCYKSIGLGVKCDHDKDCRTQKCTDGICVPPVPACSFTQNITSVIPIKGTIKNNTYDCPKPDEPTINDAENSLDRNPSTVFVNNWAINGGIEVKLKHKKGLHSFRICNSDDCPECCPICYKLEAYCEIKKSMY